MTAASWNTHSFVNARWPSCIAFWDPPHRPGLAQPILPRPLKQRHTTGLLLILLVGQFPGAVGRTAVDNDVRPGARFLVSLRPLPGDGLFVMGRDDNNSAHAPSVTTATLTSISEPH